MGWFASGKKSPKKSISKRSLRLESLETRELLSVSPLNLPEPDYVPSATSFVSEASESPNAPTAEPSFQVYASTSFTTTASVINLAPPKSISSYLTVTPTTMIVRWGDPKQTSALSADAITHFRVVVQVYSTKQVVQTFDNVSKNDRSLLIEGLDAKTRYSIVITSMGGEGTSSTKSSLTLTPTTAAFPVVKAKASNITLSTATVTVTDTDKVTPFMDGKTTKTYVIQYAPKESVVNWNNAKSVTISAGTPVTDAYRKTVTTEISGLNPGTQYVFRVVAQYTDGVTVNKAIASTGNATTMKTPLLPATSISSTSYTVLNRTDYEFAFQLSAKQTNFDKLGAGVTVSYSLQVSIGTATDKTTKALVGAVPISGTSFGSYDSKGIFTMNPVSLETLAIALGNDKLLATKSISVQLVATFNLGNGQTATAYSRVGKLTLPSWYAI